MGEKTIYYIIGIGVIGIGIGRYENYYIGILSVSADIEKSLSVVHWKSSCSEFANWSLENKENGLDWSTLGIVNHTD